MSRSVELLKKRYLKNIKEHPDLFIGIELEYPIVNLEGKATDGEVVKDLFRYLPSVLGFTIEKVDDFGNPIQLFDPVSQDTILFEVAYMTIEFAFGKAKSIREVEERFTFYMATIQNKLGEANHAIVGCGIHPNWDKNENCPVAYPRYQIQARDYLTTPEIQAFTLNGDEVLIHPQEEDFQTHRSYQYQDLTTRGTVEFRSVCTQPLDRTFASAAFHLGLLLNLDKLEAYLQSAPFFTTFGLDYKSLRRQFSKKRLTDEEEAAVLEFSKELLTLAEAGLEKRDKQEMVYLEPLKKELGL